MSLAHVEYRKNGMCVNSRCIDRHSFYHLQKNRHTIPCYWEANGGCKKPNCPFKHIQTQKLTHAQPPTVNATFPPKKLPASSTTDKEQKSRLDKSEKPEVVVIKPPAEKKSLDFGVKSFEEIMREKKMKLSSGAAGTVESSVPSTPTIGSQSRPSEDLTTESMPESPKRKFATMNSSSAEPTVIKPTPVVSITTDTIKESPKKPVTTPPVTTTIQKEEKEKESKKEEKKEVKPVPAFNIDDDDDLDRQLAEIDELLA